MQLTLASAISCMDSSLIVCWNKSEVSIRAVTNSLFTVVISLHKFPEQKELLNTGRKDRNLLSWIDRKSIEKDQSLCFTLISYWCFLIIMMTFLGHFSSNSVTKTFTLEIEDI